MLKDQCLLRAAAPAPAANVKCLWTSVISAAWHGIPHETPAARRDFKPLSAFGRGLQLLCAACSGRRLSCKGQGTAEPSCCPNSPEVQLPSPLHCWAQLPAQIPALAMAAPLAVGWLRCRTPTSTRGYLTPKLQGWQESRHTETVHTCITVLLISVSVRLLANSDFGIWLAGLNHKSPFLIGMIAGRTERLN